VFSVGVVIGGVGAEGAGGVDNTSGVVQVAFVVVAEGAGSEVEIAGGEGAGSGDEAGGVVRVVVTGGDGADGAGDIDVVVEAVVAVAGVGIGGVEGARAFAGDGAVCDVDKAGDIVSSILLAVAISGVAKMQGGGRY